MILSEGQENILREYLSCEPEYHYYPGQKFSFSDQNYLMGGRLELENGGAVDVQEILPLEFLPNGVVGFVRDTMQNISEENKPLVLLFKVSNEQD